MEWIEWVDWVPPTRGGVLGKGAFIRNSGDDELIHQIERMKEEDNVMVAGGKVRVNRKEGNSLTVQFCNIFELENGKVKRMNSYGSLLKDSAQ